MTVHELIEELKKIPNQEMEVVLVVHDYIENNYCYMNRAERIYFAVHDCEKVVAIGDE